MKITINSLSALLISLALTASSTNAQEQRSLRGGNDQATSITVDQHHRREIVGGAAAAASSFPYFVDLGNCGASLIHADLVLTSARCLANLGPRAYVGSNREVRSLTLAAVNPNYDATTSNYDLMVIKLDSPVTGIFPVGLESNEAFPTTGQALNIMGLGSTTNAQGQRSTSLQVATINEFDYDNCNERYGGTLRKMGMFCAMTAGRGSCSGDGGTPVIDPNTGLQVGITSFGLSCADATLPPTVYARVTTSVDWIQQEICCLSAVPPASCAGADMTKCPLYTTLSN